MSDLTELLARLEAATSEDRIIDREIAEALFPEQFKFSERWGDGWLFEGGSMMNKPKKYTASLDAAVSLVERVLPGVFWSVTTCSLTNPRQRYSADTSATGEQEFTAPTAPLALMKAIVSALIAKEPPQ